MIELNQSWAGPYHRMPLELPKDRAAMIAKAIEADDGACSTGAMMADPYPPDVLAVCPQAREWGVVLIHIPDSLNQFKYTWRCGGNAWNDGKKEWYECEKDIRWGGNYITREEATRNPPTIPPPGYVAAKPEAKPSLLDELAEVAHDEWFNAMGEDATAWKGVALAVARRLLEREPSEAEVRAASDAPYSMRNALKDARRAQLAELEGEVPT